MSVRIRFKKVGRRHRPSFRLAAMESRRPRDSKVLEELGTYHPVHPRENEQVTLKRERIEYWLRVGAQPTESVRRFLKRHGVLETAKADRA